MKRLKLPGVEYPPDPIIPPDIRSDIRTLRPWVDQQVQALLPMTEPSVLAQTLMPAIYLKATSSQGGWPSGVPAWPEFGGQPQQFLLAVRLSDVQAFDPEGTLPPAGWLNFFMAPDVMTGAAPLTACAVVFTPDESASVPSADLTFTAGLHVGIQPYEFASEEEHMAALIEDLHLDHELRDAEVTGEGDYLLGKQCYANPEYRESTRDVTLFTQQHGRDDTGLRALLSLTRDTDRWPFFAGTNILSVTFFIRKDDLNAGRFDRVIVDVASL